MKYLLKMMLAIVLTIQFSTVKSFANEEEVSDKSTEESGEESGGTNICDNCVPADAKPGEIHEHEGKQYRLKEVIDGVWEVTPVDPISFGNKGGRWGACNGW